MKTFQLDEWQSVVILTKTYKRWDNDIQQKKLIDLSYTDFRLRSRDTVDRACFVCYIEDGVIKTVLKDRSNGGEYEPYVYSFLTNEMRYRKLQMILS